MVQVDTWECIPDSKVHVAHMRPTWDLSAPGGPHIGPLNFAIRDGNSGKWELSLQGPVSINIKTTFRDTGISIMKVRQLWDCLIFIMNIHLLVRWYLIAKIMRYSVTKQHNYLILLELHQINRIIRSKIYLGQKLIINKHPLHYSTIFSFEIHNAYNRCKSKV